MLSRPESKKPLSGSLLPSTGARSNSTSFSQVNHPQDLKRSALDSSAFQRRYFTRAHTCSASSRAPWDASPASGTARLSLDSPQHELGEQVDAQSRRVVGWCWQDRRRYGSPRDLVTAADAPPARGHNRLVGCALPAPAAGRCLDAVADEFCQGSRMGM
jgi:hypothetical protein